MRRRVMTGEVIAATHGVRLVEFIGKERR